jgi:TolB-like protein/Flp pilus assembly protein TadD
LPNSAAQLDRLKTALADRYTLERELGRGGMATVWLAQDLKHDRSVALKVLRPELAAALGPERFLREVRITARLNHPHILPLLDSGEVGGFVFYTMPYVEGESLRDRLAREKQLALDDALRIAREVADALSYAHSHDVVHRDIKPENILLESGHAVVADFGIARAITAAGGERLTETGIAVGTPPYMSPEQAAGSQDLDGRCDQYSLGCVLYEMLAGRPPFVGPTLESVLHQHLTVEPQTVASLRPAVPGWVSAALSRALAKTPADRFNTVAGFGDAITPRASPATAEPSVPVGAGARYPPRRRARLVGAGLVVLLVGVLALGRWLRPSPSTPPHPRTAIAVLPFQNLSGAGPYAYFAGGLHEELLTQLAKVAALKVISRTSVMEYATGTKPLKEIADELDVGTIVEGSVQVAGERLRVNVQLIDAATDEHLWAEHYDRTLDDAFAVQSDVAERIVAAVGAALTSPEARAIATVPTGNAEAYRLYLQGEDYRRRPELNPQTLATAEQLYERAVSLDSTFALAYASLSIVHGLRYWLGYDPYPSRVEQQREAAEAALRLAPDLPQAHWVMGMLHYWGERDFARALPELTAAAEALPGSAELWTDVGWVQRRLGHWDEALAAFHRAAALAPRDARLFFDLGGQTLMSLRRYDEAISAFDRALELAPNLAPADLQRANVYALWRGQLDTLRAALNRGPQSYANWGPALLWRSRLALWERAPDSLLALLAGADTVIFQSQIYFEPALLYVAWAQQMRGSRSEASAALQRAAARLGAALRRLPDDWRLHASRSLALAGLGREADARKEVEWLRSSTAYHDLFSGGPRIRETLAMTFAQLGRAQDASAELDTLLAGPSWMTSARLVQLDPRYDRVRQDARFQALLTKYANPGPVH